MSQGLSNPPKEWASKKIKKKVRVSGYLEGGACVGMGSILSATTAPLSLYRKTEHVTVTMARTKCKSSFVPKNAPAADTRREDGACMGARCPQSVTIKGRKERATDRRSGGARRT